MERNEIIEKLNRITKSSPSPAHQILKDGFLSRLFKEKEKSKQSEGFKIASESDLYCSYSLEGLAEENKESLLNQSAQSVIDAMNRSFNYILIRFIMEKFPANPELVLEPTVFTTPFFGSAVRFHGEEIEYIPMFITKSNPTDGSIIQAFNPEFSMGENLFSVSIDIIEEGAIGLKIEHNTKAQPPAEDNEAQTLYQIISDAEVHLEVLKPEGLRVNLHKRILPKNSSQQPEE